MIKVVILVSGGVVQGASATEKVDVKIIDADDLRDEGKTWDEITVITNQAIAGMVPVL